MKNINFKTLTTKFLTVCAIVFGLTTLASAAVNPELINKTPNGDNSSGGNSYAASVSADGRYVVFDSFATNLVSGITDGNNVRDIFLRDTLTGTTRCLSCVTVNGSTSTANGTSQDPIISPDGRYVVFPSAATNLLSSVDSNNSEDIFRFDTQTNERVLVSTAYQSTTVPGNAGSGNNILGRTYDMSDDGRYIAFSSSASDLTGISDTNNLIDVFVRDMQDGATYFVSRNLAGNAATGNSFDPSISANGQYIAFTSSARDLTSDTDNNFRNDVFLYNFQTGTKELVSFSINGGTGDYDSSSAVISKDGSRIAYFTNASNLTNNPIAINNEYRNVIVYDFGFKTNSLVTVNVVNNAGGNGQTGNSPNAFDLNLSISADGRYITFESKAGNLINPPTGAANQYNIYRRDLRLRKTELVSVTTAGTVSSGISFIGIRGNSMSRDGRFVVFYNAVDTFADYPNNGLNQIYVRDMTNGVTTALSLNNAGTTLGNSGSANSAISANGKAVVFTSDATNLTPTPTTSSVVNVFKSRVPTPQKTVSDFDGDGKTDYAVWRPASGSWFVLPNTGIYTASTLLWGTSGDRIVPADFTGDGRTDYAVWRPSNGTWYITDTANFGVQSAPFGLNGDVPLPGDYDGDGRADLAVFRPSNNTWYIAKSGGVPAQNFTAIQFGQAGDVPVAGDFDGDGKADVAVFRPSNGTWYYLTSTGSQFRAVQFGTNGDRAVPADYDGDGKTDVAVYRSGTWYILRSLSGQLQAASFGLASDVPAPGDYDGDGKADIAVFRPSEGNWYVLQSTNNALGGLHFGQNGDAPVPAAFVR